MPPKFESEGSGEYQLTALASVLQRHPSQIEGVSLLDKKVILQGHSSYVQKLERIGQAACFTDSYGEAHPRADQFLKVTIDGFGLGIRQTFPDIDESNGLNIVHMPGFGEVIESGSAYNLHTSLATQFPGARVVSIASDGIGTISDKLNLENALDHGITGMAEGRLKLLESLFGDQPILITSCSMGTAETQKMLELDLNNGKNLNAYPIYYDTAVVEPYKTLLFMGVMFPPHMVLELPYEIYNIFHNDGLPHLKELAKMAEQRGGDALPMLIQVASLMGGVAVSTTANVSKHFKGTTISGVRDPLRRIKKWAHIKNEFSPELHIVNVPWRGHGMAANGEKAGVKIKHETDKYKIDLKLLDLI